MSTRGLAYRAASGRCLAPRNVVNGLALAGSYACDTQGAMSGVLRALCPDDDPGRDTEYHSLVRVAAATIPSGRDAAPLGGACLARAAQQEVTRVYDRCVIEGVFPGCGSAVVCSSSRREWPGGDRSAAAADYPALGSGIDDGVSAGFGLRPHPVERAHGRLAATPFPAGVKVVAYADDLTVLVGAPSRSEIETVSDGS
ncbi:hypothetical protein EVAR_7588_1 [Eumeta japonica]|uniref:Uncharacterized protein n=1 Tax=Eumeta variegata TaxID=151549 RepID=A0A4C2ABC9_EUMVA|nr:hypothetical protein EVAR_7588_1 [Eumeta japonica]